MASTIGNIMSIYIETVADHLIPPLQACIQRVPEWLASCTGRAAGHSPTVHPI